MFGMELAGGAMVFLGFVVLYTLVTVFALYTRRGSGIAQRPYLHVHGGAPGAGRAPRMGGSGDNRVATWTRGCR